MSIQSGEILETVKMVADQHFDVRTITIGIDLHDCISTDINVLNQTFTTKLPLSVKIWSLRRNIFPPNTACRL